MALGLVVLADTKQMTRLLGHQSLLVQTPTTYELMETTPYMLPL